MKVLNTFKQPTNIGVGLFLLAAVVLIGITAANYAGLNTLAIILAQAAQPVIACAISVLVYLSLQKTSTDSEA